MRRNYLKLENQNSDPSRRKNQQHAFTPPLNCSIEKGEEGKVKEWDGTEQRRVGTPRYK